MIPVPTVSSSLRGTNRQRVSRRRAFEALERCLSSADTTSQTTLWAWGFGLCNSFQVMSTMSWWHQCCWQFSTMSARLIWRVMQALLASIGLPIHCIPMANYGKPEFALRKTCISLHVAPQRVPIDVNIHFTEVIKYPALLPYAPEFQIVIRQLLVTSVDPAINLTLCGVDRCLS